MSIVEIKLTQGKVAIVDEEDYEKVSGHKWRYGSYGYAVGRKKVTRKWVEIQMARLLLEPPEGLMTDHINHDRLDNRRSNIRTCTASQNNMNRRPTGKTGIKGVQYLKSNKYANRPWKAMIYHDGVHIFLGNYSTAVEATLAYNDAAKECHGEYAYINEVIS